MRHNNAQSRLTLAGGKCWRNGLMGLTLSGILFVPALAQGAPHEEVLNSNRYVVNKQRSRISFSIGHFFVSAVQGQFSIADGQLIVAPQNPEHSAITIRVAPGSVSTGNTLRDEHLRAADFFDVAKFPIATFTSTGVVKNAGANAKITGLLSLHGITQPVFMSVSLKTPDVNASSLVFTASGSLKRSDFGMNSFPGVIGDDVTLNAEVEFDKEP